MLPLALLAENKEFNILSCFFCVSKFCVLFFFVRYSENEKKKHQHSSPSFFLSFLFLNMLSKKCEWRRTCDAITIPNYTITVNAALLLINQNLDKIDTYFHLSIYLFINLKLQLNKLSCFFTLK